MHTINRRKKALSVLTVLRKVIPYLPPPMSQQLEKKYHRDPYIILISCLLSLRARDTMTLLVSEKLFTYAKIPEDMINLSIHDIEKIIHPLGFYRKKAKTVQAVSREILKRYGGIVPHTQEALLSLPGVGRKTANLVLAEAFDVPAICVDTHVHKLSNQLGLVHTKTPYETELALQKLIPRKYWRDINRFLVTLGQHTKKVCALISPEDRVVLDPVCACKKERIKKAVKL